jgi:hypothetical protein
MVIRFENLHIGKIVKANRFVLDGKFKEGADITCEVADLAQDKRFGSGWGVKLKVLDYPEIGDVFTSDWLDSSHISAVDL